VSVFGIGFLVRVFLLLGRLSHQGWRASSIRVLHQFSFS
jgi:hypothetical protein